MRRQVALSSTCHEEATDAPKGGDFKGYFIAIKSTGLDEQTPKHHLEEFKKMPSPPGELLQSFGEWLTTLQREQFQQWENHRKRLEEKAKEEPKLGQYIAYLLDLLGKVITARELKGLGVGSFVLPAFLLFQQGITEIDASSPCPILLREWAVAILLSPPEEDEQKVIIAIEYRLEEGGMNPNAVGILSELCNVLRSSYARMENETFSLDSLCMTEETKISQKRIDDIDVILQRDPSVASHYKHLLSNLYEDCNLRRQQLVFCVCVSDAQLEKYANYFFQVVYLFHTIETITPEKTLIGTTPKEQENPICSPNLGAALFSAVRSQNKEDARRALRGGADPNARNSFGETALHISCGIGDISMVAFLFRSGANVNVQNKYGDTPLHYASNFPDVVSFLVGVCRADEMIVNQDNCTYRARTLRRRDQNLPFESSRDDNF